MEKKKRRVMKIFLSLEMNDMYINPYCVLREAKPTFSPLFAKSFGVY